MILGDQLTLQGPADYDVLARAEAFYRIWSPDEADIVSSGIAEALWGAKLDRLKGSHTIPVGEFGTPVHLEPGNYPAVLSPEASRSAMYCMEVLAGARQDEKQAKIAKELIQNYRSQEPTTGPHPHC